MTYKALIYENGHRNNGIQASYKIEKAIANRQPRKTCQQLEIDANKLGHKIIRQYSNLDKEFDRRTDFGAIFRTIFP